MSSGLLAGFLSIAAIGCVEQPGTGSGKPALRVGADRPSSELAGGLINEYENKQPDAVLTLQSSERSSLLAELRSGDLDVCFLFGDSGMRQEFHAPVGYSVLIIVVNEKHAVENLGLEQLREVYRGKATDWAQLSSGSAPIHPVTWPPDSSERLAFDSLVAQGNPTTSSAQLVATNNQLLQKIGQDPSSIGYIPLSIVDSPVMALKIDGAAAAPSGGVSSRYPLIVPVILVSAKEPDGEIKAFLDWVLSVEGQQIVARYIAPLKH